jgi:hypothetical protein
MVYQLLYAVSKLTRTLAYAKIFAYLVQCGVYRRLYAQFIFIVVIVRLNFYGKYKEYLGIFITRQVIIIKFVGFF